MTGPDPGPWSDLLDALEERNRRWGSFLSGGPLTVPDVLLHAAGPLPDDLVLRAELVLAETQRLEQTASRARDRAGLALHYGRA